MSGPNSYNRKVFDIENLKKKNYKVLTLEGQHKYVVKFNGPSDSVYEGGVWLVLVHLSDHYPSHPPSITFINRIFHPNIYDPTGLVCLDVLQDNWQAYYELINVFEVFLPELLRYPNPSDPMNTIAAKLFTENPVEYNNKIKSYIQTFATEKMLDQLFKEPNKVVPESSESSLSDCNVEENQ